MWRLYIIFVRFFVSRQKNEEGFEGTSKKYSSKNTAKQTFDQSCILLMRPYRDPDAACTK